MNHVLFIQKRCARCEKLFDIPNLKESKARDFALLYTPCSHCYFVEDITNPKYQLSGRCLDCSTPFALVNHKAKGRCHRCLMKHYRTNSTKTQ